MQRHHLNEARSQGSRCCSHACFVGYSDYLAVDVGGGGGGGGGQWAGISVGKAFKVDVLHLGTLESLG